MLKQDKTDLHLPRGTWFFQVASFLIEFIEKAISPLPGIISIPAILSCYRQLARAIINILRLQLEISSVEFQSSPRIADLSLSFLAKRAVLIASDRLGTLSKNHLTVIDE